MTDFQDRFERCLKLFEQARDKEGRDLVMFAFGADANGEHKNHLFVGEDRFADLRSVSKVVACLVLGVLTARGARLGQDAIALEMPVEPLLRHHMTESERSQWSGVRLVDLLNNTIGHEEGFLFRKDLAGVAEDDYLRYVFEVPLAHAPGTHFAYSNVGPFLFSVIVQDWLGESLHDLARRFVLNPLDIESQWRTYGAYSAGCTGLAMRNGDLLKIAVLLRDGGRLGGTEVVPWSWVDEMSSPRTITPHMFDSGRVFPKYAYGLGLWVCKSGSYYCDGTNGQYLIVVRDRGVAMSTTGNQPDMKPITKCMLPFVAD
jgi:CubicO group peptidase (beta-lactamase class C family)